MRRRFISRARALFLALGVIVIPPLALAEGNSGGSFRVIDGDTIELGREKIRLDGIDAPELAQSCNTSQGKTWPCGRASRRFLERLVETGQVTCTGSQHDAYDRRIATCHVRGRNLNSEMIRSGHALAFRRYSTAYVMEEETARLGQKGLWAGTFEAPWDYRAKKWQVASQAVPEDCPIKGNISANGRIYHTPWSPHYNRTRINEASGERWFCSEIEAIAAGWRPPE
ncbi:MAG: thermonuclease family protein [Roseibium sp.]|uniref:thermonuclease family protein n=1 Tax=Roseibium sp. TaxID=1936156 RepID=UPI00326654C5